jgi:hypothetical protein
MLKYLNVLWFSLASWLIPFIISIFMYDVGTKTYKPDFWTFKLIMFVILSLISLIFFFLINQKTRLNWIFLAIFFVLMNSVLDNLIIVSIFKSLDSLAWTLQILPVYLIVFFGTSYLVNILFPKKKEEVVMK